MTYGKLITAEQLPEGTKLYKVLVKNAIAYYTGFDYTPYLPDGDKPGKWLPAVRGRLIACYRGYHVTSQAFVISWFAWTHAALIYEVELAPNSAVLVTKDKLAVKKMRLTRLVRKLTSVESDDLKYNVPPVPGSAPAAKIRTLFGKDYLPAKARAGIDGLMRRC